jgi:hypothetical protein
VQRFQLPDGAQGRGSFTSADGASASYESEDTTDEYVPEGTSITVEIQYIGADTVDENPPVDTTKKPAGTSDRKQPGDQRTAADLRRQAWERAWQTFDRLSKIVRPVPTIKLDVEVKEVEVRDADGAYRRESTKRGKLIIE